MKLLLSRIEPSDENNAIIYPQDGSDGPYWTLILDGGSNDEQREVADYIVRAVNAYATSGKMGSPK